jgi:hypothetical protein
LPSAGVEATCASSIPCIRPRNASGVFEKRITERSVALTESAAPAIASIATPSHNAVANPKAAIAKPHTTIAAATAIP